MPKKGCRIRSFKARRLFHQLITGKAGHAGWGTLKSKIWLIMTSNSRFIQGGQGGIGLIRNIFLTSNLILLTGIRLGKS